MKNICENAKRTRIRLDIEISSRDIFTVHLIRLNSYFSFFFLYKHQADDMRFWCRSFVFLFFSFQTMQERCEVARVDRWICVLMLFRRHFSKSNVRVYVARTHLIYMRDPIKLTLCTHINYIRSYKIRYDLGEFYFKEKKRIAFSSDFYDRNRLKKISPFYFY